jgi:hypothetical protein
VEPEVLREADAVEQRVPRQLMLRTVDPDLHEALTLSSSHSPTIFDNCSYFAQKK